MTTETNNEQEAILNTEIVPAKMKANELIVKSADDRISAVGFCHTLKELKETIEAKCHFTQNKKKAYIAYEGALDTEGLFYKPIDEAIKVVNQKIKSYDTAEAIKAQQIAAKAEADRLEKERIEREKLEAKAKKAEEQGKTEKAEALREQAETVTVAPVFTPPTNGKKLVWKCEVTSIMQLCKAITDGQVPFNVLEVRQSALNDFAKSYDGKSKIDGLRFWQETSRV